MIGHIEQNFEHHATIELPDGRRFQVDASDIERSSAGLRIRAGARVEHIFPGRGGRETSAECLVEVPNDILDQLL